MNVFTNCQSCWAVKSWKSQLQLEFTMDASKILLVINHTYSIVHLRRIQMKSRKLPEMFNYVILFTWQLKDLQKGKENFGIKSTAGG